VKAFIEEFVFFTALAFGLWAFIKGFNGFAKVAAAKLPIPDGAAQVLAA
jgi:hypothetical protein